MVSVILINSEDVVLRGYLLFVILIIDYTNKSPANDIKLSEIVKYVVRQIKNTFCQEITQRNLPYQTIGQVIFVRKLILYFWEFGKHCCI